MGIPFQTHVSTGLWVYGEGSYNEPKEVTLVKRRVFGILGVVLLLGLLVAGSLLVTDTWNPVGTSVVDIAVLATDAMAPEAPALLPDTLPVTLDVRAVAVYALVGISTALLGLALTLHVVKAHRRRRSTSPTPTPATRVRYPLRCILPA